MASATLLNNPTMTSGFELRPLAMPPPYKAMLAICSDLDETPDRQTYWEIARFLNTTQATSMGPGVGLEVGNTIYFDMPKDQFSYWNTDDAGRSMVHDLIRSGHIDCLHSFGDHAVTRGHAGRALDALAKHDCRLETWIDHAQAVTNFGSDIMVGSGDLPGHDAYHADLTTGHGVQYVWRGRVTSVIGQDVPRQLAGVFDPAHKVASAKTVAKEAVKGLLARRGSTKYAMHAPNEVLRAARLRDGRPVIEFLRANPYWGGVENAATADGLAEALTEPMLRRLVARGGTCILYTHLGKVGDPRVPFKPPTVAALRLLAEFQRRGEILVTTTRRLLGFRRAMREIVGATRTIGSAIQIQLKSNVIGTDVSGQLSERDCEGLAFEIPSGLTPRVFVGQREIPTVVTPMPDRSGMVAMIPWSRLTFPSAA